MLTHQAITGILEIQGHMAGIFAAGAAYKVSRNRNIVYISLQYRG